MRRRWKFLKKILINSLLVLLFLVGFALVFNKQIKDFTIKQTTEKYTVNNFNRKEIEKNQQQKDASFNFDDVAPISSEAVLKAKLSNKRFPVIGGVAVPSVGINLPIFKGLSNDALLWGAGTVSETQVMGKGNYGLASHHADKKDLLFTPLTKVKIDEKIYLTNLDKVYIYRITNIEIVSPTDVQCLDEVPNKKLVTLLTCDTLAGTNRIIVQGELIDEIEVDKASQEVLGVFEMEQKTY
ncbi:class A sortase [Enterococcus gallinarum]|uniref:class A sortase n=1 Tax=Enterococcus gallinarum TaxID=1353 RepID=UPI003D7FDF96